MYIVREILFVILSHNFVAFFQNNEATHNGGALTIAKDSNVTFTGKSLVLFISNKAAFA